MWASVWCVLYVQQITILIEVYEKLNGGILPWINEVNKCVKCKSKQKIALYINSAASSLSKIDNVSTEKDEFINRAYLVEINARLDTFTSLKNL